MKSNCPKCGREFEDGVKFCSSCGCELEADYNRSPVCPTCKTSYPLTTRYCAKDGSRLVSPQRLAYKCMICGTTYPEGTKFCPSDGGEVKVTFARQFPQSGQLHQMSGVNQKYPKASLGSRFLAAVLDGLITMGLAIPGLIFFAMGINKIDSYYYDNDGAIGLLVVGFLFYLIPLGYAFIKDGLGEGQSWGKKALDLMVINLDTNMPCDKGKSFFRNFISGLVAIIPFVGWLIEPILVVSTDDGRNLGDKAANTQVIDKRIFNVNSINKEVF